MKRTKTNAVRQRLIAITGTAVLVTAIAFGFAACPNDTGGKSHTHEWGEWETTTPATCVDTGLKTRVCKLDATHTGEEEISIDPNAHVWGDWDEGAVGYIAPTCTATGTGSRVCTACGETDTNTIIALGHDYQNWTETTAPTCTTAGIETGTCTHDSSHTTTRTGTDALGHDYEWVTTTSTSFIVEYEETKTCNHDPAHTDGTRTVGPLPITSTANWTTALSQIAGKGNAGVYTLTIEGDVGVAGVGSTAYSFGTTPSTYNLNVTLKGDGKLYLTSQGYLFRINARQTLIIDSEDLTLQGLTSGQNDATQSNNTSAVDVREYGTLELKKGTVSGNTNSGGGGGGVSVNSGTFTMRGGEISGNTALGYVGGGVYVTSYGAFNMHDGKISGNTASNGGGVHLVSADFNMHGGEISGNTVTGTSSTGGGVNMTGAYASFRIVTGTIYGSTETDTNLRNTGGAFSKGTDGVAQRGTFAANGTTWNTASAVNLESTTDTIKVKDGEFVVP